MVSNHRVNHIDAAKGISIFLVAMFHSPLRYHFPEISNAISVVRMPFFFFISGLFFSQISFNKNIVKKARALLKPYFVFGLIVTSFYFISGKVDFIYFFGLFYATGLTIVWIPMWFLPHLFLVYLVGYHPSFYLLKNRPNIVIFYTLIVSLYISLKIMEVFSYKYNVLVFGDVLGLPFSIDILPITAAYYMLGRVFSDKVKDFKFNSLFALVSFLVFSLIAVSFNIRLDLNLRLVSQPILVIFNSFLGIYCLLSLSVVLSKYKSFFIILTAMGRGSLFILIFHYFLIANIYPQLVKYLNGFLHQSFLGLLSVGLGIFLSLLINTIFIRFNFKHYVVG